MKDYTIIKKDNIEYLQFNRLSEYSDKLIHAIFLKNHNIGFDLDNNTNIRNNSIGLVKSEFCLNTDIIQSRQNHSDNIMVLHKNNSKFIFEGYDGYVTSESNIATLITFADCIPIFIYDPKINVYANIHSGWRGIVNQISVKAVKKLIKLYNSNIKDLICCIGPNISKECFLVNSEVVEIYKKTFNSYIKQYPIIEETELYNEKGKQYRIDNNLLLETMLKKNGILEKNIVNPNICTVCNSNDFHSRRSEGPTFQKGGGLMMLK